MVEVIGPGSVVAVKDCPNCSRPVGVKLNKNRIAYYYCNGRFADDEVGCGHHERFNRPASDAMFKRAVEARKAGESANDNRKPEGGQHGGSGGGLDTGSGQADAPGEPDRGSGAEPEPEPEPERRRGLARLYDRL